MPARILSKLTYANVMATAAVFIALGGGAYAAIKLPKNSVGTAQLKSGAVTKAKVNKTLLKSLTGAVGSRGVQGAKGDAGPKGDAGAKGDPGEAGQTGATGATGPSDLFRKSGAPSTLLPADGTPVTVITASLPPGKYLVSANLGLVNNSTTAPADVECVFETTPNTLVDDEHVFLPTRGNTDGYYHTAMMQLTASGTLAATTTIALNCLLPTANMRGLSWVETSHLHAIRVGSVNDL
jgi:hypothetical protein